MRCISQTNGIRKKLTSPSGLDCWLELSSPEAEVFRAASELPDELDERRPSLSNRTNIFLE
jgi:hypothetical protein